MDNVTHTLIGLAIAEMAIQIRARRKPELAAGTTPGAARFRLAACFVSMLANNVPDFDALYTGITPGPLGSLLHHRGHTHTLILAIPLGLLALLLLSLWARRKGWELDAVDRRWLLGLALAGGLVHISLDAFNNYGVHPFWPFYHGWFYGDSVFIIEPFLWAALVPPLYFAVKTRAARIVLASLLGLGVVLCWIRELVPRSMALSVTLTAAALLLAAFRARPLSRATLALAAALVVFTGFASIQRVARSAVLELASRDFPNAETHDLVLTPMPANPLCWSAILLQTEAGQYHARSGVFALWPGFLAVHGCPFGSDIRPTAPSRPVPAPERPELRWARQFSAPAAELRALGEHCVTAAFLRFARAPFWTAEIGGARVVGDVRYDRAPDLDFSDIRIEPGTPCPPFVPPWTPPRLDLLRGP